MKLKILLKYKKMNLYKEFIQCIKKYDIYNKERNNKINRIKEK